MGHQNKIRHGIRECKPKFCKPFLGALPGGHDFRPGLLKIRPVLHGLGARDLGRQVHCIGIIRIFNIIQGFNQCRASQRKANAHTCHGTGLAEGLDHQQVVIPGQQLPGGGACKVNVCLIHDYNNILVGLYNFLYLVQGHIEACGRIGVWEYNSPIFPFIIQRPDSHISVQCRRLIGNPVQICPNLVKGIGDVRKQHRPLGVKKGQEGHGYNIVRTNAHKHLVLPHPVIFCQSRYKLCGRRVWILAQTVRVHFP